MNIDLLYHLGIGDTVISTAAVTELKQQFPHFNIRIGGVKSEEIFENNPCVANFSGQADKTFFLMDVLLKKSKYCHCLDSYYEFFNISLGLKLKRNLNKPVMFLKPQEKIDRIQGKYSLISTGFKKDFTVKNWGFEKYQQLVDHFDDITFIQVGKEEDNKNRLSNVIDAVGLTSIRELATLVYNSEFGIGPDSLLLHLYAAFDKDYYCLKSGFNPSNWIQYKKTHILSKADQLFCGQSACWKHRITPMHDGLIHDHFLCSCPALDRNKECVAGCMEKISVEDVIGEINARKSL